MKVIVAVVLSPGHRPPAFIFDLESLCRLLVYWLLGLYVFIYNICTVFAIVKVEVLPPPPFVGKFIAIG
jgi:hypothetical protein